jgi:hypothetical protein
MLRRTFLRQGGTLGLAMLATPVTGSAQAQSEGSGDLRFEVSRNGSEIGHHVLTFTQAGERLTVDIDIELRVRFAFITAYSYTHRNREEWEDGRLLGFSSRTDDNGTKHSVEARREGDELIVNGSEGRITAPTGILPGTYWHRRFLDEPTWINTQTGEIIEGTIAPRGAERIAGTDGEIEARRYRVTGDIDVDLWYADERWVKLAFDGPDGSRIDYRMVEAGAYRWLSYVPGVGTSNT